MYRLTKRKLFEVASSKPGWNVAYYAALLASNTTARGGELRGLRIDDVNPIERTLRIQRSSTKTDAGARVIPLNESALWACVRLLERVQKLGASDPNHYLFPAALFRHTKKTDAMRGSGFDFTKPMQCWRTAWRNSRKKQNSKVSDSTTYATIALRNSPKQVSPITPSCPSPDTLAAICWSTIHTFACRPRGRQSPLWKISK